MFSWWEDNNKLLKYENEELWQELQRMHIFLKKNGFRYKIRMTVSMRIKAIRNKLFNSEDIVEPNEPLSKNVLDDVPDDNYLDHNILRRNQN